MAGLPGLGRGRGKRPDPNAKLKPNTVKGGITSSDLLGFFNLEPPSRTFTVPQTATGGMGYVKYAEVDVSERKRREKDKDYAKYYQDQEFKDMTQSMGSLNYSEQTETDVNVTQSDVAKGSNLTSNTQASQMDDIEDLTTIGDLPSFKDLSQEQFTDIYKRYSSCFKDGRHNADLTVSRFKDEIIKTVNMRDTVIIYSPTGTGKTTQVPQYILGHHFKTNRPCKIVVTQPRRIAATSVARRVAKEMRVTLGTLVGYQIGMEKESSPDTCITYMTTGVLLQKLIAQKNMNDFTHVIIDEIHERDQDTDFLMLVVRKYLRFNSRNTKVILMSATIDTTIYSKYFAKPFRDGVIEARVLQLEGKPNDVPEFYLDSLSNLGDLPVLDINEPKVAPECYFLTHQLIKSFDTLEKNQENSFLTANDSNSESRGTVLVFLPGYEHIVAMKKQLMLEEKKWWILPLHSSVTVDEQRRVFEPPQPGFRKIILSTNIAESSITVTDIKYVIDFCLTKCLCRDRETNYVHLKLEWAAKANCDQRKGRAGRVSAGRVYRLVPEPLFNQFRQFILPEMKRCPLELVILKAKKLEMGEPKAVLALALDHPEIIDIEKSVLTLKEVGALGLTCNGSYTPYDGDLTFIGHVMAALPIDAKISKFILLGHVFGCLEDCIIIGACLSVMNIFSKPFAKRLESYKAKLAWANNTFSDCFTLWEAYTTWTKMRERNFFKGTGVQTEADWARQNFLELNRLYEVQNLIEEIKKRLIPLGIKHNYRVEHPQVEFLTSKESKKDKLYVLSVCLCGAFYPNYFLQGETEQQLVYRELSKKNPLDTVYLSGLPSDEGILYEQQIIKLFEGCSDHIRVDFESSKAFVQFSSPNLVHNASSGIARAVYLAVKMRKENIPLEITLLNPAVADKRMEIIESKKKELFTSQGILNSSIVKSSLEYHGAKIPKISLPTMNQSVVKIIIPCIVNCGNFFAQYYHEENQQQISLLENTIRIMSLTPLSDAPRVGNLVLAPYVEKQNDGKMEEKYYRAFVQSVATSGNSVEVFFLDYGNTDNVLSKKLKEFDYDEEALLTTPTQAVQFRLSSVKPAFDLNTKPGEWSESANKFFKERTKNRTLIARIYSVVERCVNAELYRTELDGKEISINDELVAHGYAEFCEEDYLSKENHDLRKVYEEMSYAHQEKFLKQYGANQDNFITIKMIENRDSNDIYSYKKLKLRGPFSPLESTFYGISQVSRHKKVLIERDSVNCVTLDSEPHDPLTRMMVASYVSMNSRGNIMNARNTTLMPSIQGLPALMILTFAPAMELRRNAQKNKYTGAICGLGFDRVTKKSYYPDHDSEIEFDAVIDQEDFVIINLLRTSINIVLGDATKYSVTNTNSNVYFNDVRKNVRKQLKKLLSKPRKSQEKMCAREPYRWGLIPDEEYISIETSVKGEDNDRINLLQMHKISVLNLPREETSEEKRALISKLHERANDSHEPELNKCVLCNETTSTPYNLMIHLHEPSHLYKERLLMDAFSSEDEEAE